MWNVLVLTIMVALTGYYALQGDKSHATVQHARVVDIAQEMHLYRQAVVDYFAANTGASSSVDIHTLVPVLPAWSRLSQEPTTSIWANYRDASGRIYIYAAVPPAPGVVSEVMRLSRNSVLVGVYRDGDATLYSPVFGDTGLALPPGSALAIPVGSPVWIALAS